VTDGSKWIKAKVFSVRGSNWTEALIEVQIGDDDIMSCGPAAIALDAADAIACTTGARACVPQARRLTPQCSGAKHGKRAWKLEVRVRAPAQVGAHAGAA
jgi:hypothetical protein